MFGRLSPSLRGVWTLALGGLALAGCSVEQLASEEVPVSQSLESDLQTLAQGRVFFGHQSVGEDILNGLKDLLAERQGDSSLPALAIVDAAGQDSLPQRGYILHTKVGQNTKPATKCQDFARILEERKDLVDVAVLKYCYVDVDRGSDAAALFADYEAQLQAVRKKLPGITVLPTTVPLTVSSSRPDWKRKDMEIKVRRMLGLYEDHDADNLKRARFNTLLRETYKDGLYLDIAKLESTHADGKREGFAKGGLEVPSLIPAYTYDGGHLNETGRKIVAREFVKVMAQAIAKTVVPDTSASVSGL
jgi:hypothetical protein